MSQEIAANRGKVYFVGAGPGAPGLITVRGVECLQKADVVVHLVGGYTQQREMATERIVRESLRVNPTALQITVNIREEDIPLVTPGMVSAKAKRIKDCESMVRDNCLNTECLRLEANLLEQTCDEICQSIASWQQSLQEN